MACTATALILEQEVGCATPEELGSVISDHLPMFYRKAYRYLGNVHDAEDAVQDALLSAYKNLSQFRGQARLSTWLTTIVINAARMRLRRRPHLPHVPVDEQFGDGDLTLSDTLSDCRPSPEEICQASELHEHVWQFASELSPSLRKAFQLRVIEDVPMAEIAQRLGAAEGTVKAQISRARAKLARHLRRSSRRGRHDAGSAQPAASLKRKM